ncbi:hypothetical protein H5T55_04795 [Candidatus Bipolaricaulota bacterium]|nr:hypothetical protein [Candidatus Bipolaricaulota bacterium]
MFEQFARACRADNGALWGTSLLSPVLLVDRETRDAVASQPDPAGQLTPEGAVFVGQIPPDLPVANTALDWAGLRWVMVVWQTLPDDPRAAVRLLAHEAFHRVQEQLGFPWPETTGINAHLDDLEGRYWLQLEWCALARALRASGEAWRRAVADALLFRHARRALCPQAAVEERVMEMHEGLAEYTGVKLARIAGPEVAQETQAGPARFPSFVQSFAYLSGPAYGLLLDAADEDWRAELTPSQDLGCLLQDALGVEIPAEPRRIAFRRARGYRGAELRKRELARRERQEAQLASYRAHLAQGPVLVLPLAGGVRYSYDPAQLVPLGEEGTVFPAIRLIAPWGTLEVTEGGILVDPSWQKARVSAPTSVRGDQVAGEGWRLGLAPGWLVRPATPPGRWELVRTDSPMT